MEDRDPEVIREQMEETRAALQDKLESLEQQVVGTVTGVTEAVKETVDTVKNTVTGTAESVKETVESGLMSLAESLDLRRQTENYPWAMMLGAVAFGYFGGRLIDELGESAASSEPSWTPAALRGSNGFGAKESSSPSAVGQAASGLVSGARDMFGPELQKLKSLAVAAALGVVRDTFTASVPPPVQGRLSEVIDDVTRKLGGEPIRGPILTPEAECRGAPVEGLRQDAASPTFG